RREFLEVALQFLANEGSAILFSSHQMDDVERIASRICMLRKGRKIIDQELDTLQEDATLVTIPTPSATELEAMRKIRGCLSARISNDELRGIVMGTHAEVNDLLLPSLQQADPRLSPVSLEDLFIELAEGRE
ncbi:MAG: hypothetical protein GY949_08500, partial [Gammaproteobacteria bacterium]|nr:hypothetical protein [Gammaproteobacteria bacterium]